MQRIKVTMVIVVAVALLLAGCNASGVGAGPAGETTCREWLELDNNLTAHERIVEQKENTEQQDILRRMLADHDRDTGESNRIWAEWAIIQFCYPDDTGTRPNIDQPIENAIDW